MHEHDPSAPPSLTRRLRDLPILRALDERTLVRIAEASRVRSYDAGGLVFHEGEPCRGFFAVLSGGVKIFRLAPDGREQVLQRLRPGNTFAEAALLTMPRYPASAAATESPTEVLEIGGKTFLQAFESDVRVGKAMVASLSMWLLRLVARVEELSVLSAGARFARYLLDLPSKVEDDVAAIEIPLPKKDLAAHLGITPETLSRLLRKWQDRGVIRSEGRRVLILDSEHLLAIAEDTGAPAD